MKGPKIMTQTETTRPTLGDVKSHGSMADMTALTVDVSYSTDERPDTVTFVGKLDGYGPVVMISRNNTQLFVSNPGRHGPFCKEWVRRFFA